LLRVVGANEVEAVIRGLVSRNLLEELLIAFVTAKLRISENYFFKSGTVDALDILGAATRTSDWIERV
jgi:hypothetical protein